MKKIIAIMLILMVGLLVLGGCTSTTTDTPQEQQKTPSPEPEQNQQAGTNEIPQPPALPEE